MTDPACDSRAMSLEARALALRVNQWVALFEAANWLTRARALRQLFGGESEK